MKVEPKIILNFIACQVAWSACALGGANDRALAGTMVAAAVIALQLALARRAAPEALLIAACARHHGARLETSDSDLDRLRATPRSRPMR